VANISAPVDGITRRFDDPGAVREDAIRARRLGFGGKLCIHPKQVASVNDAFSPTDDEIAWARQVVDADAAAAGGVTVVGDGMIDRPVMLRARSILASARRDAAGRDQAGRRSARLGDEPA
jgi:citrate lyase subunit beta/citryl-CoA lyase